MPAINITQFVRDCDAFDYSHSMAEGGPNAGPNTWRAANQQAERAPLLDSDACDAWREHVKDFGAWNDEKIAAWSETECNALFIQYVSGDLREAGLSDPDDFDWNGYQEQAEAGQVNGNLFRADDGDIYYSFER